MGKLSSDSDSSKSNTRLKKERRRSSSSSRDRRSVSHRSRQSSSRKSSRYERSRYYSPSYGKNRSDRSSSRSRQRWNRKRSRDRRDRYNSSRSGKEKFRSSDNRRSRSIEKSYGRSSTSSTNSSRSSSNDSKGDTLREKLLKVVKAAANKQHVKETSAVSSNLHSQNDFDILPVTKPDYDAVQEIEEDGFVPRSFRSSKSGVTKTEDVKLEPPESTGAIESDIFHPSIFDDPQAKLDRWVKKLFQIRQRAFNASGYSPQ